MADKIISNNLGSSIVKNMDIIDMFTNADFVVKAVIVILLIASFAVWTVFFDKFFMLRSLESKSRTFLKDLHLMMNDLESLQNKYKKDKNHPMAKILAMIIAEQRKSGNSQTSSNKIMINIDLIRNRWNETLESGMSFLSTTGASAPFIGLFGTVWGIMNSFQAIASSKNTSLAIVAPGIAEALFATAIGLFAAIPAVIFYNYFNSKLNVIDVLLDDFSNQLVANLTNDTKKSPEHK